MKSIAILLLVLLTFPYFGSSQVSSSRLETKVVVEQRNVYLNGGARASVGGKSRSYIQVNLPENTKSWYYSFTTYSDGGGTDNLNLALQLGALLVNPSGITSAALNTIRVPYGSMSADIYLLSTSNLSPFMDKDDNWGGSYNYYLGGTTLNTRQGVVAVDGLNSGTFYLGLKNPSTWDGVNILIEVVAIVEHTEVDYSQWSVDTKAEIVRKLEKAIVKNGASKEAASKISACFIDKLTAKYVPSQFQILTETETNRVTEEIARSCIDEIQGGTKTDEQQKGASIGGMGWSAYENGDLEKAIAYSIKALEYDSSLGWVHGNLGLFYLIQGDELLAVDYYLEAINLFKKDQINRKNYFDEAIKDLKNALKKYPTLAGHKEIIEQLERERDDY